MDPRSASTRRKNFPRKDSRVSGPALILMDDATKRRVDDAVADARPRTGRRAMTAAPGAEHAREGQTFAHRGSRLARVRELRQAAAHVVRAAVRARRRRARVVSRAGHVARRSAGSCSRSPARASRRWGSIASSTARSTRAIRARASASCRAACSASPRRSSRWRSRRSVFVCAAWQLNSLCGELSPFALGWVFFYSYTKRFTRWCHLVLGVGMSIAPVGGYLAVTGRWSTPWWMLVALALARRDVGRRIRRAVRAPGHRLRS